MLGSQKKTFHLDLASGCQLVAFEPAILSLQRLVDQSQPTASFCKYSCLGTQPRSLLLCIICGHLCITMAKLSHLAHEA